MSDEKLKKSEAMRTEVEHSGDGALSRRKLAAELAVHRTELEMQNLELREAQHKLELSRARYFALFDLSPVPYLVVSPSLAVVEANLAAAELLGVERSRLVGSFAHSYALDSERDLWRTHLAAAFGQSRCPPFDSILRQNTGTQRHIHFACQPFDPEHAGADKLLLVAMLDITDRVEAERERQQLSQKLLETQKLESLGVLAGGVAHDFNNLLTGVLTAAALMREELPANSPTVSLAEQIETASQRAADLCKQLLAYAGKGRMTMGPLRINPLVSDLLNLLSASLPKRHRLSLEGATYLPPVKGDATQIRQIVMNLIVNASEAIGNREGTVRIRTGVERIDPKGVQGLVTGVDRPTGDYVFFEVQDDGCGMSLETMSRIFDPFFTTKFTGRGLGLAAVLGIVRGHGGLLAVRSQQGAGSTFRLWLPVAESAAVPAFTADRTPTPLPRVLDGARILVIDDEPIVRHMMGRVLGRLGCEAVMAESGQEAVKLLATGRNAPNAILLDITMPGWDGPQTFVALRERGFSGPIFFMSGYAADDISHRLAHLDAAGFLQKPIVMNDLVGKLGGIFTTRPLSKEAQK